MGEEKSFHTSWGEFGGYKHPNALRYECSAMLAYGAKCSIGDQLHPSGTMDFSEYKVLILPDEIQIDEFLKGKLDSFLASGGKLFLSGESGFDKDNNFQFDIGGELGEISEFSPDFIEPLDQYRSGLVSSPIVMYTKGRRLKVTRGNSMGKVYDPYFNRTYNHFCSHRHTPNKPEESGYDCGV